MATNAAQTCASGRPEIANGGGAEGGTRTYHGPPLAELRRTRHQPMLDSVGPAPNGCWTRASRMIGQPPATASATTFETPLQPPSHSSCTPGAPSPGALLRLAQTLVYCTGPQGIALRGRRGSTSIYAERVTGALPCGGHPAQGVRICTARAHQCRTRVTCHAPGYRRMNMSRVEACVAVWMHMHFRA